MAKNKLQLTSKLINDQKGAKEILELEPIQENWIQTYSKTSGRPVEEARNRYEAEKVMFMQAITANSLLQNADKFSIYSAWTELAISGGTLRDGICYIVPFGKKAVFLPGWKFRLEQINEIPNVIHCHAPQVVYECDEFEYERGMKTIITKHKPGKREEGKNYKITHVYFVIEFKGFADVYLMERADVLRIRDQYSVSFKQYMADITRLKVEYGKGYKKEITGRNGSFTIDTEPPMWVKDEAQAFCKTLVKQVWKTLPKLPKQKFLEERLAAKAKEAGAELDAEELADREKLSGGGIVSEEELKGSIIDEDEDTPEDAVDEPGDQQPEIPAGKEDKKANQAKRNHISEAEVIEETKDSGMPPPPDYSNPNEGF